ncbi:MAG: hypothetical protein L0Z50_24280 [Verrucomicrobiales bacterium]|nr:hypothetical protein [Verrucomicrobiales bacterium]
MKPVFGALVASLLILSGVLPNTEASTWRTQTIALQKGWNAVFLEVYPDAPAPAAVFANTPIDVVAAFYARTSTAQFVTDPGADLLNQAGWAVWYAESRPDAFLKTLHATYGQQAYLVHAAQDHTWTISGSVVPPRIRWQPDSFNLVGFSVSKEAPPTFAQFFAGSKAHRHNRLYRLVNGSWQRINDPSAEPMRSGEAFWIYCDGGSKYQGPLSVETTSHRGVMLWSGTDSLILRNQTDFPIRSTVEQVATGADAPPLSIVARAVGFRGAPVSTIAAPKPAGAWTQAIPVLAGGAALRLPLEARRQEQRVFANSALLKISTDLGTEVWIPVVSIREDLEEK